MLILVIGSGSIACRHVANLQALHPDVDFVLLRRDTRRDDWSDSLGAKVVGDVSAAIATRPDCAIIATPSARHMDVLPALVKAGLPMYVEKPVVTSLTDIEQLRQLIGQEQYRAPTLVGCNLRFLPSLQKTRSLIESGTLGVVIRASLVAGQWLPDWRPQQDYRQSYSAQPELGGGVVFDLVHELDVARWFFGEFERVHAMLGHYSGLEIQSEDCAGILLGRASGGPVVAVSLDYVSRRPVRHYEIVGTEATLHWDLMTRSLEVMRPNSVDLIDCGEQGFDVSETYLSAMREFLAAVKAGTATSQDIHEGLASAELAVRVKAAART